MKNFPSFIKVFVICCLGGFLFLPSCRDAGQGEPEVSFPVSVVESVPEGTGLHVEGAEETYRMWKKLLSASRESIKLGMFYMVSRPESRLDEIIEIIEERVAEGVSLEVVTDRVFYEYYPEIPDRLGKPENAEVRIIDLEDVTGGVMHAKYFIVDGFHFYVGSANFDWRSLEHIREIGLGGSCRETSKKLTNIFRTDFSIAGGKRKETLPFSFHAEVPPDYENLAREEMDLDDIDLKVVGTPPATTPEDIFLTEEVLIKMINSARDELIVDVFQYGLTGPYAPGYYDHLDRALRRAAVRGADVKVMVADWALNEIQQAHLKSLQMFPGIEVRYISIPPAGEGHIPFARVSHPKLLIADGRAAWTGSSNWQPGYFDQSRNVGLITSRKEHLSVLREFFQKAWEGEYAHFLEPEEEYQPPRRE